MNQLRQFRQSLHLSQAQLALLLGVTPATVGTWDRGTVPHRRMRRKLARLYRVTEDELGFGQLPQESEAD